MSDAAIEVEGLCRRYGPRWALVDVSFTVPRGGTLLVAGRNGSGKSTLLRLLASAIAADRGTGRVDGIELAHRDEIRKRVALLGHPAYCYEALTAKQNLTIWSGFLGIREREPATSVLRDVGLERRADDRVATFSAGMRKRLTIARLMLQVERSAPAPSVVLLDEPYAHLDTEGFDLVEQLVSRLRGKGTTLLIATHRIDRAAGFCDDAIVLAAGEVAWSGAARELAARVADAPLRVPTSREDSL